MCDIFGIRFKSIYANITNNFFTFFHTRFKITHNKKIIIEGAFILPHYEVKSGIFKEIYKSVVTSSSFWAQKLENFNNKNRIYLAF